MNTTPGLLARWHRARPPRLPAQGPHRAHASRLHGRWVLLPAILLTGCSLAATAGNSPHAQCERQSYDDPTVRAVIQSSNGAYMVDDDAYRFARRQALQRCLRQEGLIPPGGVEPVEPTAKPITLPIR